MKPKVIKPTEYECVGKERSGTYWVWIGSYDSTPGIIFKKANHSFSPSFTYQEYQGEIPEFPREKTDKEKLNELIAAAEMVTGQTASQGWCSQDRNRELQALIEEFKEQE